MGVDYMIGYGCVPKEAFTSAGLLERVKAGARADIIEQFYRDNGDQRPVDEMGFELEYRAADGLESETQVIYLKDLRALHAELADYESFCAGCPANHRAKPFGCIGSVNYPISALAEIWMLEQLPGPEYPIPFLLLKQGQEFGNTGATAAPLRTQNPGTFFESLESLTRRFPEMDVNGEQLFELMFLGGAIQPKRAAMILLFMGAINRELEADQLMAITPADEHTAEKYPFLLRHHPDDDPSIRDLKQFLGVLYQALLLDRDVLLDV